MTLTRRQLFAGAAASAGLFVLDDIALGTFDDNALAASPINEHLTLGNSKLGIDKLAATPNPTGLFEAQNWAKAPVMYNGGAGYADGANIVTLADGAMLSTLTINPGGGEGGGHTIILRSVDGGGTWQRVAEMEREEAPEAVYGTPWLVGDRVYILYQYNQDNVRVIPNMDGTPGMTRVDIVGVIAYRMSTDGGLTWTDRQTLELPVADIDLANPWGGEHQIFWMGPGPVLTHNGVGYLGITKIGPVIDGVNSIMTQAFLLKLREEAPGELSVTVTSPILFDRPNTEEPRAIVFEDGVINVAFRNYTGQLGEAWSTDDGATWEVEWARDRHGDIVAHPVANTYQITLPDGRHFLWGHNNSKVPEGRIWAGPRNPAFYRLGERSGNRIVWGPPKLLLWDNNPDIGLSGPCFMFDGDTMILSATDKKTARILHYPMDGL